jgi:predicted alpha/beta superfamily hydrolase
MESFPFCGIIAGSPSLWWPDGGKTNFEKESALYNHTKNLPLNFYMCMGSDEGLGMVPLFKKMTSTLGKRDYQGFNLKSQLNEGKNHASNKRICFREGHLWILNQSTKTSKNN